ncbi:hypothetical protein Ahy_B09g098740 [Arachis hypogaea]|uniref:PB1-like domain-containing protein n=1 Tax=Arachis hypogaea TaxID=3818 RepID=A0A444XRY6_ARAHY|nr:hypothetical protein Ahy_B09g098740 [Arachis hypogaea]
MRSRTRSRLSAEVIGHGYPVGALWAHICLDDSCLVYVGSSSSFMSKHPTRSLSISNKDNAIPHQKTNPCRVLTRPHSEDSSNAAFDGVTDVVQWRQLESAFSILDDWHSDMDELEVIPVFHHGGIFKRNAQGKLEYVDGKVKKWPPLDIDLVNFFDFETLLKELGYREYKTMFWFDCMAPDLESGLHVMRGDTKINDMRSNKIKNKGTNEIHIYFDHPVSVPEVVDEEMQAEEIIMSDSSSSGDGYETTEDEPYKPPPPEYEETHSSDDSEVQKRKERLKKKKKKMVSPRKRAQGPAGEVKDGPDGEVKSGPNRDLSKDGPTKNRDKPGPSKGGPCYSPKTAKKRASKRYSGRRRKHILRDGKTGAEGAVVDGPEVGGGVEARHGLAGDTMASSSDIVGEELDSDYENPYEYESEAFNSPDTTVIDKNMSKARKAKKKLPKNQREEISVSQSAPPAEEAAGKNSNDNLPPIPAPGPTLWFKSQPSQAPNLMPHSSQLQSNDSIAGKTTPGTSHDAISEETMAAATSTTASRLLKFVPTPGYRPPGLRPPKQGHEQNNIRPAIAFWGDPSLLPSTYNTLIRVHAITPTITISQGDKSTPVHFHLSTLALNFGLTAKSAPGPAWVSFLVRDRVVLISNGQGPAFPFGGLVVIRKPKHSIFIS